MKVLLIQPAKAARTIGGEQAFLYEPLALEYLAAAVAPHHDVEILDMRLDGRLEEALKRFPPDVVGVTAYTVHVNVAKRLFALVKGWDETVLTVVGGHHATVKPEDFLDPHIDLVVIGDGIAAFRQILERRERGEEFAGIPGVACAADGTLVGAESPALMELDDFPLPARSFTARYRRHYFSEWMKPLASMRTSKGCPFRCSFCALWKITGGRYLKRDPVKVVEELGKIEEEFVFFADDESLVDTARMTTLATLIRDAGLKKRFFLYGRSDTIARHPELLEQWRGVGLERVFVGLEFFRDEDLGFIRKGSTTSDNEKAVGILKDLGIEMYPSFIVRPEFTKEDFAAYARYGAKLGLGFASFSVLTPLPGTDLFRDVEDKLITRDYDLFDFLHALLPTTLPLQEFYAQLEWLYNGALPLGNRLAFLRRFPLREIPSTLVRSTRILKRLRNAYRDHDEWAERDPEAVQR